MRASLLDRDRVVCYPHFTSKGSLLVDASRPRRACKKGRSRAQAPSAGCSWSPLDSPDPSHGGGVDRSYMEPGRTSGLLSTAKRLRPPFTAYGYSTVSGEFWKLPAIAREFPFYSRTRGEFFCDRLTLGGRRRAIAPPNRAGWSWQSLGP